MESTAPTAAPSAPSSTLPERRVWRVVGTVANGLVRLCIVAAALAVPAHVLWQQRNLLAHSFLKEETHTAAVEVGAATVLLGRPSGVAPRPRPIVEPERSARQPDEDPAHLEEQGGEVRGDDIVTAREAAFPVADPKLVPGDFEVVVAKGLTLGEISATYYGTSKPRHVQALAAYNGLSDANKLRLGQKLRVPHVSKLGLE